MLDYIRKYFYLKFDSGDEDSGDEGLKISSKGKEKLSEESNTSKVLDENPEQVTSKKESPSISSRVISREEELERTVLYSIAADEITQDTKTYIKNILALGGGLKKFNNIELNTLNIKNKADIDRAFIPLVKEQGITYSKYRTSRAA
jgi:hypothetical protein